MSSGMSYTDLRVGGLGGELKERGGRVPAYCLQFTPGP